MPLEEARNLRTIKHYEKSNHSCGVVRQPSSEFLGRAGHRLDLHGSKPAALLFAAAEW
jgi:hypothetical protein